MARNPKKHITLNRLMTLIGKTGYYTGRFGLRQYNVSACLNYMPDSENNFIGFKVGTNEKYDDAKVTCKRCINELKKYGL